MSNTAYLSPLQLAKRWGFHSESVRRMIREGRLTAYRFRRHIRIALADIERFEAESVLVRHGR